MSKRDIVPPYDVFPVTISSAVLVTPLVRRLTVNAAHVAGLNEEAPGQYLKVFVRDEDGYRVAGRAYTVRRFSKETGTLDLDFVLHGDEGNISKWAARVDVGDTFEISRPNSKSGLSVAKVFDNYLFAADETGLPAVASILETLPATARGSAFIEVAGDAECQDLRTPACVTVNWLLRERGQSLVSALESLVPPSRCYAWVTAESSQVAAIRSKLKPLVEAGQLEMHASGYWKLGQSDHRDDAPA